MIPNTRFWTDYFRQAIRELKGFHAGALEKVVPAFDGIAEDAEKATEEEYGRLGSMPAYDDQIDMSDVADMAMDHGRTVYETMSGVRQGVLNVLAVGSVPPVRAAAAVLPPPRAAFQSGRRAGVS